jgi:hypothetical protein
MTLTDRLSRPFVEFPGPIKEEILVLGQNEDP